MERLIMESEHATAVAGVGIADLASQTRVELTGADRVKLLNNLCTNDLKKLPVGAGVEAFLLDARGRIVDFIIVYQEAESLWLDAGPGRGPALLKHLDRYIIREDVRLADRGPTHSQFHLVGPKAQETLAAAIGAQAPNSSGLGAQAPNSSGLGAQAPSSSGLSISEQRIDGLAVQVRSRQRSRYPGFDLVVPVEHSLAVRAALIKAGLAHQIHAISDETLEILRLEAGLPLFGVDFDGESFAQEIGRDASAISFTKGCYIGQETVARIDAYGHVNRMLRGLILHSKAAVERGAPIYLLDKEVGKLGTCAVSPLARKPIALAVLRSPLVKPGANVKIGVGDHAIEATVVDLPFSV